MTTWPAVEEMRRGITLMRMGCHYFAWQRPDNTYHPCYDVEQLTRFESGIFEGRNSPGFYAIRPDNQTRWGALDFDAHGTVGKDKWRTAAQAAYDLLKPRFAESWFLESSPGSFHTVFFLTELRPAIEVRAILTEAAPGGIEIFPKQDVLKDDPKAKGSLLRFPGRHQAKGTWGRFISRSGCITNPDEVPAAKRSTAWSEPTETERFNSLYAVATRGIIITGPGQRFRAMQRLAGRLKGRCDESTAHGIYCRWHGHYAAQIGTPLEEARKAFLAWYRKAAPCNVEIPDYPPSPAEAALLESLPTLPDVRPELLQATVRLFLSAGKLAHAQGRMMFLGLPTLAQHLGVSITTAWRYRSAVVKLGIAEPVEQGHTGYATTYKLKGMETILFSGGNHSATDRMVSTPKHGPRIRMVSTHVCKSAESHPTPEGQP